MKGNTGIGETSCWLLSFLSWAVVDLKKKTTKNGPIQNIQTSQAACEYVRQEI